MTDYISSSLYRESGLRAVKNQVLFPHLSLMKHVERFCTANSTNASTVSVRAAAYPSRNRSAD